MDTGCAVFAAELFLSCLKTDSNSNTYVAFAVQNFPSSTGAQNGTSLTTRIMTSSMVVLKYSILSVMSTPL